MKNSEKICPSAIVSTTNLKWTDPGTNPGLHSERPVTNRLSYDTAYIGRGQDDRGLYLESYVTTISDDKLTEI
jgi:hypothetical protein